VTSLNLQNEHILLTGGSGLLGSAVREQLTSLEIKNIIAPRSNEIDLRDQTAVRALFEKSKPSVVIHLAGKVGGISANSKFPGSFFYDNISMGLNLIEESRKAEVKKFLTVGAVCMYPKGAPTPLREEQLWDGYPEPTNGAYAIAKRAIYEQIKSYRTEYNFPGVFLILTSLYGPRDNFSPEGSHVIPALIRRCSEATRDNTPEIEVWGSGKAEREYLFVEDAAEAIIKAVINYNDSSPLNIGSGEMISIVNLTTLIAELCGFKGKIKYDTSRPDGEMKRCLDFERAKELLNFIPKIPLSTGLSDMINWFSNSAGL
jgi:GDP-L-fucose synthase